MIYANLIFTGGYDIKAEHNEELVSDYIESFLGALYNNGQVINYFEFEYRAENKITYNCVIHDVQSLMDKNDSTYVAELKSKLIKLGIEISFQLMNEISKSVVDAGKVEELILFAGVNSPLRTLKEFNAIPLYCIGYTTNEKLSYSNIKSWEKNYLDCYSLWFRGEVTESLMLHELSAFNSELSKQGIRLCRIISGITTYSCYYYLFRESNHILPDKCPSCGGDWLLKNQILDLFNYKCDVCELIS